MTYPPHRTTRGKIPKLKPGQVPSGPTLKFWKWTAVDWYFVLHMAPHGTMLLIILGAILMIATHRPS